MNLFRKFFFGTATLALLAGCSDDISNAGQNNGSTGNEDGPSVYLGVNFQMPGMGSTRSFTDGDNTSNNGTEVGTDVENNVNEVLLVLARRDYGFIGAASVMRDNIYKHQAQQPNAGSYHATAKFNKTELSQYYSDAANFNKEICVFVIANPTGGMVDRLATAAYGDTEWINTPWTVSVEGNQTEGAIWSSTNGGNFLMTNSQIAVREIPQQMSAWDSYTSEDKCFNLSEINGVAGALGTIDNSAANASRGPVKVERATARFDFRDGSPANTDANTYPVVYIQNPDGSQGAKLIDIKLNKMALVNMGKTFYYLKRVSNNGLNDGWNAAGSTNGWALCGAEKPWYTLQTDGSLDQNRPGNYIVDYFAQQKNAGISENFSTYFNYAFFDNDGTLNNGNFNTADQRWYVSEISDVLSNGNPDNWDNNGNKGTYKVWRYLTENVAPGIENQVNGISTAVVFKGKMLASNDLKTDLTNLTEGTAEYRNAKYLNDLINAVNSKDASLGDSYKAPILYSYAGSLYCTWQNVYDAAVSASFSYTTGPDGKIIPDWNRTNSLYKAVFGNGLTGYKLVDSDGKVIYNDGDEKDLDQNSANYCWQMWNQANKPDNGEILAKYKKAVTDAGFTIYQRSEDNREGCGYYCYYYYWNRHNDNGKNGIMGPMEFAVVRNNVYKLAVTHIARLGHPRISQNDPDSPKPDTPDESSDIYFTVDAEVVPWTVRVNDIVFE